MALGLPSPVLAGLPPPWDRTLFACPRPLWPAALGHLMGLAAVDRRAGRFWRGLAQAVPLLDVVALSRSPLAPPAFVEVTLFGIDAAEGTWAFEPAAAPLSDHRLRLRRYPADPGTAALARATLGGAARWREEGETP